eukprot:130796_1
MSEFKSLQRKRLHNQPQQTLVALAKAMHFTIEDESTRYTITREIKAEWLQIDYDSVATLRTKLVARFGRGFGGCDTNNKFAMQSTLKWGKSNDVEAADPGDVDPPCDEEKKEDCGMSLYIT